MITAQRIDRLIEQVQKESGVDENAAAELRREKIPVLNLSKLGANKVDVNAFKGFPVLRKLDLSDNELVEFPENAFGKIGKCQDVAPLISWLKLTNNKLGWRGIKPLSPLEHLVTLNLGNNCLARFPKVLSKRLVSLKALVLDHNELKEISISHKMTNLNSLVLSHNAITSIEVSSLKNVPNLQKLSISDNKLEVFPEALTCCLQLAEVRIAHNKIATLPKDKSAFKVLAKLKLVDIGHNKLDTWKDIEFFSVLPDLVNINFGGNPIATESKAKTLQGYAAQVSNVLRSHSLKILDSKPVEKYGIKPLKIFENKWKQTELKRKKNLISNKLQEPDPSKPRNKPCSCGSGIKYKLCCEKKESKTETSNENEIQEPISKRARVVESVEQKYMEAPKDESQKKKKTEKKKKKKKTQNNPSKGHIQEDKKSVDKKNDGSGVVQVQIINEKDKSENDDSNEDNENEGNALAEKLKQNAQVQLEAW
mmetsp:Transcript_19438/g.24762  ORF Transcript_19438/g.24762 Transcript_19438/m.24762 type:complete len:480 (+) Transcript_19438:119-1558(+)